MKYLESSHLGNKSKKMLSILASEMPIEMRAESLREIVSNPYFSFQKKEMIDYMLYPPTMDKREKDLLVKALDVILIASGKGIKKHKRALFALMEKDKDFAPTIASYFISEKPKSLGNADLSYIVKAGERGHISENDEDKLSALALRKKEDYVENMEKLNFEEENLNVRKIAGSIRNYKDKEQGVLTLADYISRRNLKETQYSSISKIFDYNMQYLTYTMLNDSKVDSPSLMPFLNLINSELSKRFIEDGNDERSVSNMLHIMNDSEIFMSDKKLIAKLSATALAINAKNDHDFAVDIAGETTDIINSNLGSMDVKTFFEDSIVLSQKYKGMYPITQKLYSDKKDNAKGNAFFPDFLSPEQVEKNTLDLLKETFENMETYARVNMNESEVTKIIDFLEGAPLEKSEETTKSLSELKFAMIKNSDKRKNSNDKDSMSDAIMRRINSKDME